MIQLHCFGYFDASINGWSKDIFRDPLLGDMDLWELREALFLAGRHEVTDEMVVQMVRSAGKVEHADVRINFREFTMMCWKWFFEEPKEDGDASDVRAAFEILGGGPGTEGQVSVDKLKSFASSAQLTIDVDKFVGEVDEDGSGLVDYDEFCRLFADSKIDTNLHDTGQVWLRNDKDDVLGKDPAGGGIVNPKRSVSPTNLKVEESMSDLETTGKKSRPDSAHARAHEHAVTITHFREGFFDDVLLPFPGTAVLHAPKMKKVLQNTLPKFERTVFSNSVDTKCRRGWRCSQMSRNCPRNEGYNYYNVKPIQFQELNSAGVKMRKRGAEYTVKEPSTQRINVRLSTEMRCLQQSKLLVSRPQSRAATSMGGSLYGLQMMSTNLDLSQANNRPKTVPLQGSYGKRRNLPTLSVNTGVDGKSRGIAEGLLGSRGLMSSWGGSVTGTTRNYGYKDTSRNKAWQTNMRTRTEALATTDLLKLAASAGMYDGRGFSKNVGPGHSFFDGTSP